MTRRPFRLFVLLAFVSIACKQGDADKDDKKGDDAKAKAEGGDAKGKAEAGDEEGSLKVATGDEDEEGPVPPETSMVFFSVEGALLPLACFDKDKGKVESGDACLDLVPADSKARISSIDSAYTKPIGERAEPDCTRGAGKKNAFAVEGITEGANYKFATWPTSAMKIVKVVPDSTLQPGNLDLSDDEKAKIAAASGRNADDLQAHQIAEIDVDGNGEKDKFFAIWVADPKVAEQYAWSGIFFAPDGDLGKLALLEKSSSKKDVYEIKAILDIDGDGKSELWMRQVFAEGSGDRLVRLAGGKADPIGKWSCGA